MRSLGIDPGLTATGLAWCIDGWWGTATLRATAHGLAPRIAEILALMDAALPVASWDVVTIEHPQAYQGSKNRHQVDPNDIVRLSILAGALAANACTLSRTLTPLPVQWKGGVPKDIHHRRLRARIPGLGRVSKDAMDAVGLCLYGQEHICRTPVVTPQA